MNRVPLHEHPLLARPRVRHGWTDARGPDFGGDPGTAGHAALAAGLARAVGLTGAAWAHQVHAGTVLRVGGEGCAGEADALWTDESGLGVIGRSADCPLVLIAGTKSGGAPAVGFAHASWRSTVRGITAALVHDMGAHGVRPETVRAVVCPSAGPCCYEIGDDVRDAFDAAFGSAAAAWFVRGPRQLHLDLRAANRAALLGEGVPAGQIAAARTCTICAHGYPSYRREGARAARFAAVVGPVAG